MTTSSGERGGPVGSDRHMTGRVLPVDDLAWRRGRRLRAHPAPRRARSGDVVVGLSAARRRQGAARPAAVRIAPVARLRVPVVLRLPVDRRAGEQDDARPRSGGQVVPIRGHGRDLGRSGHPVFGDPFARLLRSLDFEGPSSARRVSRPPVAAASPGDPPADDANSQLGRGVGRGLRWRPVLLANTEEGDREPTPVP